VTPAQTSSTPKRPSTPLGGTLGGESGVPQRIKVAGNAVRPKNNEAKTHGKKEYYIP